MSIIIVSFVIVDSKIINILVALPAVDGSILTLIQLEVRVKSWAFTVYHML
jgi:hypothetical protein